MKSVFGAGACTAAILAFGIAAYADTTAQTPSQPAGQPTAQQPADRPAQPTTPAQQSSATAAEAVTITGCVQREADYRKSRAAGQGGAANTGVGAGNEFVLINASSSTASSATGTQSPTASPTTPPSGAATGTAGTAPAAPGTSPSMPSTAGSPSTAGAAMAYELTGPGEGQLEQYVGRRVEITGKLKAAKGVRPSADPAGKDLNLRELEVTSVRESTGSCPAAK